MPIEQFLLLLTCPPRCLLFRQPLTLMIPLFRRFGLVALCSLSAASLAPAQTPPAPVPQYKNFAVAIYIPVGVVNRLADPAVLQSEWDRISSQLKVDKVYIEPERDRVLATDATLEAVKNFFVNHGVRVAGGITYSDNAGVGQFKSFCYTDPADRAFVIVRVELRNVRATGELHGIDDQNDFARSQHGSAGNSGDPRQLRPDVLHHDFLRPDHFVDMNGRMRLAAAQ